MRSHEDDRELVAKSLRGDTEAFRTIVERYQERVYNVAFQMTGSHEDSLDLAQDSFLRVFRALSSFKGDSSLGTWIHRIAHNIVIDELRKRRRRPVVAMSTDTVVITEDGEHMLEWSAPMDEAPEEQLLRAEKKREIEQALQRISPEHRSVLVMRDIEGLTYEEVAEVLGLNVGTVKSRLNRARLALREKLKVMEQGTGMRRLIEQKGG
ncbi:MAG: sigma-70 family RNA polymerase sigma factor [Firmicutes bacterium]|nr:sigma-70 family RNA polymerase sigma factor [Dethiobacter sp.]MBS3888997.1 sigma-70 family RNA polymerase sigma factor [Bacillota bacterium]MBS4055451.1 sigma-70 family RNA polymerase sigma factor [Thermaerobacter sp.]